MLTLIAVVFALAWEFEVALPLIARYTFDGGASLFGVLASAVGVGAVVGGLESARRADSSRGMLLASGVLMAVAMWGATLAPTVVWETVALFAAGAAGVIFVAVAATRLQLNTVPHMRGRVMALYSICILGTRVIGGPIVGWFGQTFGARASLAVGAVAVTLVVPTWLLVSGRDATDAAEVMLSTPDG
jgi:MFS family permease